jgi:putative sterol carrier protein
MYFYPSEGWLDEYTRLLDESDALDDLSSGVGFDFDGSIHLVIADLPLETTTVGDLPEGTLDGLPEQVRAGLAEVSLAELPSMVDERARSGLPERARNLLDQIETNVIDGALHVLLEIDGGDCADAEVLEAPATRDADFTIRGSYVTWREIVDGRPSASALLTGDLRVEGSQLGWLQYATMFQLLGDVASQVETTHLFEGNSPSAGDVLVDEAVRHPAAVHRFAHRQAIRTLSFL